MRLFFTLLLLANLGFFAWQYQARGGLSDHDAALENFQPTDPGVTPLTLLSERPAIPAGAPAAVAETEALPLAEPAQEEQTAAQQPVETVAPVEIAESEQTIEPASEAELEAAPAPEPVPAPAIARRCLELGPSADRAAIEQAEVSAQQVGARTHIRETAQAGAGGYWVRLPDYYSFAEARAKYRELQQKGVDDIAIVPLPDKRYFVSLGVYKRKDTVEERRDEIMAKGVTPVIEARSEATKLYTLAFEYEAADLTPLQALQRTLAKQASQIALQEVACQ